MRPSLCLPALVLGLVSGCEKEASPPADAGADAAVVVEDLGPDGHDGGDGATAQLSSSCIVGATAFAAWTADPKMCVTSYAEGVGGARGMAFSPNGDLLVVAGGGIVGLHDDDGDGHIDPLSERYTLVSGAGLNHGIAISVDKKYVYASSAASVWRWTLPTDRSAATNQELVVDNIPVGGHATRTLLFDGQGRLLVSIGSASNLDSSPADWAVRSMVKRFIIDGATLPLDASAGEKLATGMRNEVGLAYDSSGKLWGVENGRDSATYNGADVHLGNPGEELNLVDDTTDTFYGYPRCWSEFDLPGGGGPGTQHRDEQIPAANLKDEAWCQSAANVRRPALVMPAHFAPLGVTEYAGGSFPWQHDLLVTSHGSWNHEAPGQVGRVLLRILRDSTGKPTGYAPVLGELAADGTLAEGTWAVRPVDVKVGAHGEVFVSDDASGHVLRIGYAP